jgi:hypothetical protein
MSHVGALHHEEYEDPMRPTRQEAQREAALDALDGPPRRHECNRTCRDEHRWAKDTLDALDTAVASAFGRS